MTYMPLTAYMNSGLATILRFSGEGTKNSHMAGGMELLATWSHVMEMNTFVGVILVIPLCWSSINTRTAQDGGKHW
jgi:hypothetical protein